MKRGPRTSFSFPSDSKLLFPSDFFLHAKLNVESTCIKKREK